MGNTIKNLPSKAGKAKNDHLDSKCSEPEFAAEQVEIDVEPNDDISPGLEKGATETAQEVKPKTENEQVKSGTELSQKRDPDFEPEFDGDLAHVSWLPMKPFGDKKGF